MNILTRQIVTEANKWVGIREEKPNDGPEIRAWLKRVGVTKPSAWCTAFVWCMIDDACKAVHTLNKMPPTASVHRFFKHAKDLGYWTDEPGPGFIGGIDHGKGKGHIVLIVEIHEAGRLLTIEGNTNSQGSREGNALMLKASRMAKDITLGYFDPGLMLLSQQSGRA